MRRQGFRIDRLTGHEVLRLTTRADDDRARAFYESAGFDPVRTLPDHYADGDGVPEIRYYNGYQGGKDVIGPVVYGAITYWLLSRDEPTTGRPAGGAATAEPEGWHSYWKNPGDTGIPTEIDWQMPEGFHVGELRWPTPKTAGTTSC